jgi:hypothetical protein
MVGLDAGNASFDTAEETGGSADAIVVSHTHTATSTSTVTDSGHAHGSTIGTGFISNGGSETLAGGTNLQFGRPTATASQTTGIIVATATTNASTGASGTNANLPPYITVRMWKRTA